VSDQTDGFVLRAAPVASHALSLCAQPARDVTCNRARRTPQPSTLYISEVKADAAGNLKIINTTAVDDTQARGCCSCWYFAHTAQVSADAARGWR
jgi:hypothetical protein